MSDEKLCLSASQIETFSRCPEQWRRRYIEGDKIPPAIAMLRGTAVHIGAKRNMQQKVMTKQDIPAKEIVGIAINEFELALKDGYELRADEKEKGSRVVIGQAKDDVADMAYCHAKEQAPDYQPVLVEKKVRIELPMCDYDFVGVLDLADNKDRIIDFKTAGRRKSQSDADGSIQLTGYAANFEEIMKRPPAGLVLDVVVKTKTKTYRDLVTTDRSEPDYEVLKQRILVMSLAIKAGIFTPASLGSWWCNPRWCGYATSCRYYNSERQAAADSQE